MPLMDEVSHPTHTRWHCWFSLYSCTLPPSPTLALIGLIGGDLQPYSVSESLHVSYLKSGPSQTFLTWGDYFVGLVFLPHSQQSPKQ